MHEYRDSTCSGGINNMDFQTYLNKSWSEHAKNPQAVADQFVDQIKLLVKSDDIIPFAHLISHVFIEHLCTWTKGKQILTQLLELPLSNNLITQQSLKRSIATMDYLSGEQQDVSQYAISDQVRILATSASGFAATQDILKAQSTLQKAVSLASTELVEKDPAYKVLAMAGNNLSSQLEEKNNRSIEETSLMLFAAKLARKYWEMAATWIEVERAEYRLSQSYLSAGDIALAIQHAEHCLEICKKNSADPMELFFANECFAKIYRKQNKKDEFVKAIQEMEFYLSKLNKEDNPWCVRALNALNVELKV